MKTFLPGITNRIASLKRSFSLSIFFALLSLGVSVVPAFAIDTQNFSAYPTHSNDADPRSKSWFIYSLPAGEKRQDSVTVVNNSKESLTMKVYAVDSTNTHDGKFALANQSDPKTTVGSWVTLNTSELTLNPKEKRELPFTIAIPANAAKGDYSGGIIFEMTTPKHMTGKNMNINVISRVGVRIYETVPGADQLNMNVSNFRYSVENNSLVFTFDVANNGTVHVSPTGMLQVKDMFGRVIDSVSLDDQLGTIVPGKPASITVPTRALPAMLGWNSANVAVYYSPTKAAVAGMTFIPNPWGTVAVFALVLLIVAFLLSKDRLVHKNEKTGKVTLAPHVKLLAFGILLGTVALSGFAVMLMNAVFGGK